MENREQKIEMLKNDFLTNYSGNGYKNNFEPDGYLTQCNFGGLLVILGHAGDSLLVWSDWADNAISTELTECEVEYSYNEEDDENEAYFLYQGSKYDLYDVMKIN